MATADGGRIGSTKQADEALTVIARESTSGFAGSADVGVRGTVVDSDGSSGFAMLAEHVPRGCDHSGARRASYRPDRRRP